MEKTMNRIRSALILSIFSLAVLSFAGAQENDPYSISDSELDALFGDDIVETQEDNPGTQTDPLASVLKNETVKIGGLVKSGVSSSATWNSIWDGSSPLLDPDTTALSTSLGATLFFDARPNEEFRAYGALKTSYPFASVTTDDRISVPSIDIFELFADFNVGDKVFFRVGKSTIKWGVGYFWSPADVINLESINLFDAEAQREGPINLRMHAPILGTQHNLYLYAIFDDETTDFETTALAAKAEFLAGSYELGLGLYYRSDSAERAMVTLTGPIGDFDFFGEAMVSRGSAKTFVTAIQTTSPFTVSTQDEAVTRETFYFSGSAGFMYSNSEESFTALAQYYYNGEGYSDDARGELIDDAKLAIAAAAFSLPTAIPSLSASLAGLIIGSGRHYAALNLSKGDIFSDDLSASVIVVANLSDYSGIVRPSLNWNVTDHASVSLSPTFVFGPEDGEYSYISGGNIVSVSLGVSVRGSF